MKKYSDNLFRLIKTLASKELEFVEAHLHSPIQKEIFLQIKRQKSYKEEKIRRQFKKKFPKSDFNYHKHILYKTILELLPFFSNHEKNWELKVSAIKVLLKKELFELAGKEIKKLKKQMRTQDNFPLIIRLLQLEHNYRSFLDSYSQNIETLFQEIEKYSQALLQQVKYQYLYMKMYQKILRYDPSGMEEIFSEFQSFFPDEPEFATLKIDHYSFLVSYYMMQHKGKEVILFTRKMVDTFLQEAWLIPKRTLAFFSSAYVLLNFFIEERRWEEVAYYFSKFNIYARNSKHYVVHSQILKWTLFMQIVVYSGYLSEGERHLPNILNFIEKHFNNRQKGILLFYVAMFFFLKKDYSQALRWMERTIGEEAIKQNQFVYVKVLLVRLIVLYESGNLSLLPYAIRSVYYALKKNAKLPEYQRFILRIFRNLLKGRYAFEKETDLFGKFYYEASRNEDVKKHLIQDFDLYLWLKCKSEGKDMSEFQRKSVSSAMIEKIMDCCI